MYIGSTLPAALLYVTVFACPLASVVFLHAGPDHLFGRATRKPMAEGQTERLHRKYVTWCVVNGMPWEALDNIGFKLIVAECDPAPAAATRDRVLREMYGAARAKMVEILGGVRGDNKIKGYDGPFCSLQLDLTFRAGVEYTALSAHLIRFVFVCMHVLFGYWGGVFLFFCCCSEVSDMMKSKALQPATNGKLGGWWFRRSPSLETPPYSNIAKLVFFLF